jgi:hypothetical protein
MKNGKYHSEKGCAMFSKPLILAIFAIFFTVGAIFTGTCQPAVTLPPLPSPTPIPSPSPADIKVLVYIYKNPGEFQTGVISCREVAGLEWSFSETESGLYFADSPELGMIGLQTASIYEKCPDLPFPFFK